MDMVRVYDSKTKKVFTMPAVELAPNMVEAKVEGVEGTVWINVSDMAATGKYRREGVSKEVRNHLRQIKRLLDDVYPQSIQEWENMLHREREPDQELGLWIHIAEAYGRITKESRWTQVQKKEILRLLVVCSMNGREQALRTAEIAALSTEQAAEVVRRYFDQE